jgi:hypothetical protein
MWRERVKHQNNANSRSFCPSQNACLLIRLRHLPYYPLVLLLLYPTYALRIIRLDPQAHAPCVYKTNEILALGFSFPV